jgi:hypothetical protein
MAEPPKMRVGDRVLLFDGTMRRDRSRKLRARWREPYTITEVDKVNAKVLKLTRVYVNRLRPFY